MHDRPCAPEIEVLKRIAAQLGISEETVRSHVKNILAKLGANDRTPAVMIALKRGIISEWLSACPRGDRVPRSSLQAALACA